MKTVKDILNDKGTEVWSIPPSATVYDALTLMADRNVGALVVENEGQWIGIFSERDYARKSIEICASPKECRVSDLMSTKIFGIGPERTIEECMKLMTDKRVRHLPVLEGKKIGGLISIGDVVKAMIHEKTFIIEQLESYINGGR